MSIPVLHAFKVFPSDYLRRPHARRMEGMLATGRSLLLPLVVGVHIANFAIFIVPASISVSTRACHCIVTMAWCARKLGSTPRQRVVPTPAGPFYLFLCRTKCVCKEAIPCKFCLSELRRSILNTTSPAGMGEHLVIVTRRDSSWQTKMRSRTVSHRQTQSASIFQPSPR